MVNISIDHMEQVMLFIIHGFIGGVLWLMIHWTWDVKNVTQHTIVSAISGYIYWILHYEYNFPNAFLTIVVGYFSTDFIKNLFEKLGKIIQGGKSLNNL